MNKRGIHKQDVLFSNQPDKWRWRWWWWYGLTVGGVWVRWPVLVLSLNNLLVVTSRLTDDPRSLLDRWIIIPSCLGGRADKCSVSLSIFTRYHIRMHLVFYFLSTKHCTVYFFQVFFYMLYLYITCTSHTAMEMSSTWTTTYVYYFYQVM